MANITTTEPEGELKNLLKDQQFTQLPKIGDIIKGTIIGLAKNEIHLDINGITSGVIRGKETEDESSEYNELKIGEEIEATVLELENENGQMELSLRYAGHKKAWSQLQQWQADGTIIKTKVTDANKGGLIVQLGKVAGFLPVSQLNPEHYPRIQGGDKNKILDKLKELIGQELEAKVITAEEKDEKLIVSEKAAWEESQKDIIGGFKIGDAIEGEVTAITDFGVFVKFDNNLEGLVHISEIAWQRIDDPKEIIKVGQKVKAEIIGLEGSKIFLSMKKLLVDPWKEVADKYQVGDIVSGKVLKANPFGLFVELDPDIHGLAHISELDTKPVSDPLEIAKPGEIMKFKVLSIEPEHHRLGLSLRALKSQPTRLDSARQARLDPPAGEPAKPIQASELAPIPTSPEPTPPSTPTISVV
ncbi:MAG: S1 RNA-binding domain-containing protein [bacterium]